MSLIDTALTALGVDLLEAGLQVMAAQVGRFDPTVPLLIFELNRPDDIEQARSRLLEHYPEDHELAAVSVAGQVQRFALRDLKAQAGRLGAACLYVPPLEPEEALGTFRTLEHLVARLRAPDGCPWDREQTHESLKADLLEEVYEALAALDARDPVALCEELGDLLLHIAFHADIAAKAGEFTWRDVLRGLNSKLIRRHPHVFGEETAADAEEVLHRWEALKKAERSAEESTLASLPQAMPALAYSQAAQERVRRAGFDWPDMRGPLEKLAEELVELEQARDPDARVVEFGDVLFNVVNIAQRMGINAEEALRRADDKFVRRYTLMETIARERGLDFSGLTLEEMTKLWNEAKIVVARSEATKQSPSKDGSPQ
ncbi:MAG TPA: nucleoside triphosphate pyrophosphohydrolase [Dehalococcoidia bacterium]|nr:nucleoside triphosphate pyrophosphohydrolase [Dehalococcoidia bacterium]